MIRSKKITALFAAASVTMGTFCAVPAAVSAGDDATAEISYNYDGTEHTRQMEKLDRGLAAVKVSNGVFLSWRLLGTEASVEGITRAPYFNVYRDGVKIAEIKDSTNYVDPSGDTSSSYAVAPVTDGTEGGKCAAVTPRGSSWFDIKLDKPADFKLNDETSYSYSAGDASCGDLDGDGEYEIVLKWDCNPQDNSNGGVTGNVFIDAYKLDGTKLWRIDLGRNIRSGAHYTQFLVYDFDLDGKAEITCKTAPGSKGGDGKYVTEVSADAGIKAADNSAEYVNDSGYILEGPEYFTIFDGETGAAIDTINYPVERVSAASWGDAYGNRCDRFIADVGYMDGERPYAVYWRGYYGGQTGYSGRTGVFAASFDGERLSVPENHIFDTKSGQPGYTSGNEIYIGQGNHNLSMGDTDGDGKDEVISGAMCMEFDDNDKLVPKWCTFRGHGDALHIGNYDPTHNGLEFFAVHEGGGYTTSDGITMDYGASVIDPATGEIIKHWSGSKDTGRGLMANVGAGGYYQITATSGVNGWNCLGGSSFEQGTAIGYNFRIFWDGDLYDETLDGTAIYSWSGSGMRSIFNADGCVQVNGTKANPALQADLFGDWREEVVYPLADSSALRVFMTTDVTSYKLPTLMHDPIYRSGVAAEQTAYNQPPHIGFYLADEIYRPEVESVEITKMPDKTEYITGEQLDTTGLEVTAHFSDGTSDVIDSYVVTGFDGTATGEQTITVTYGGKQSEFKVKVISGFAIDENGYIIGYSLDRESTAIPAVIDGIKVKGFADGALKDTTLKFVTITLDSMEFGTDVFPKDVTIIGYLGSDAYVYAQENNITYQIIDTREYCENLTYSESVYDNFSMKQANWSQTYPAGHMTYGIGGRRQGGDGQTGFNTVTSGDEKWLACCVGRFYNNGRNAYITLNDTPMTSDAADNVYETDIQFVDSDGRRAKMTIKDSNGAEIETISTDSLGAEYGKWYTYKLIYHNGSYYRSFSERGSQAQPVFIKALVSDHAAARFEFYPADGTSIGNNQSAVIYLDNTKIYTNTEFADLTLTLVNNSGEAMADAKVTVGGSSYTADENGIAAIKDIPCGIYDVTVSAGGYPQRTMSIAVYDRTVNKTLVIAAEDIPVTAVRFERSSAVIRQGSVERIQAFAAPEDASDLTVEYSSSDANVAKVDNNGFITALMPGNVVITAESGSGIKAECAVTVVACDYVQEPAGIELTVSDTAYISNNLVPAAVGIKARVYDNKGASIETAAELSCDAENASVRDGKLILPYTVKPGEYTITAVCGSVKAEKKITLKALNDGAEIIAEEKLESELDIHQGTSDTVVTIGDITYHTGARSSGGDGGQGFTIMNYGGVKCLRATTGRWADNERAAYFVFDKVTSGSAYDADGAYVFETNINFASESKMIFKDCDGNVIKSFTASELGADKNKWYHYMLIYSGGSYTHYLTDGNGEFADIPDVSIGSGRMIASVHFELNEAVGSIYLTGTKYYKTGSASGNITVRALDTSYAALEGEAVTIGGKVKTTNSKGMTGVELPIGCYKATAEDGTAITVISDGTDKLYTIVSGTVTPPVLGSMILGADENCIAVNASEDGLRLYAAEYDENGVLTGAEVFDAAKGAMIYTTKITPDKIFLWQDMTPIDSK